MKSFYVWAIAGVALAATACGDDGTTDGDTSGTGGATSGTTTTGQTTTGAGGNGQGGAGGAGQGGGGQGGSGQGGSGQGGAGGGAPVCGVPALIGSVTMQDGEQAFDVAIEGSTLYVTLESDGIRAFDLTDAATPAARGILDLPNAKRLAVEGGIAYVTQLGSGFAAVDFADLDAPVLVGEPFTTNRTFYDVVRVAGRSLLATDALAVVGDGAGGPELVTLLEEGGGRGLATDGATLFAANLIFGLNAYDVTDVDAPTLLATFDENLSIEALDVQGGIVLTGGVDTGLVRVDASDPNAMSVTGTTGEHTIRDVKFLREGLALVAADAEGILVVDTSADAPVVVATIPSDVKTNGIALGEGVVAVAQEGGNVLLLDPCPSE